VENLSRAQSSAAVETLSRARIAAYISIGGSVKTRKIAKVCARRNATVEAVSARSTVQNDRQMLNGGVSALGG
jgi:hypothetical protein